MERITTTERHAELCDKARKRGWSRSFFAAVVAADERVRVVEGLVATIKALREPCECGHSRVDHDEHGCLYTCKCKRVGVEPLDAVLAVVEAARDDTT